MIIIIFFLLILAIIAYTEYGLFFTEKKIYIYLIINGLFALGLILNKLFYSPFNIKKFFIYILASSGFLIIFTIMGYLLFEKILPEKKSSRYLYFSAYLFFLLVFSSQYPFTGIIDLIKPQSYIQGDKKMIDTYQPVAKTFGIKELDIKLIKEDMPGAFVLSYGSHASIVITTGINQLLNKDELSFVMGHEFTHWKLGHHNIRIILAVISLIIFFLLSYLGLKLLKFKDDSELRIFLKFVPFQILMAVLLSIVPLWICRNQEISADLYSISILNGKKAALSTFKKTASVIPGNKSSTFFEIFEIHPSIETRVFYIKNQ